MAISILHANNFIYKNADKASTQFMKLMYMQQGSVTIWSQQVLKNVHDFLGTSHEFEFE